MTLTERYEQRAMDAFDAYLYADYRARYATTMGQVRAWELRAESEWTDALDWWEKGDTMRWIERVEMPF